MTKKRSSLPVVRSSDLVGRGKRPTTREGREQARRLKRYEAGIICCDNEQLECCSDDLQICKRWLRNMLATFRSADTYWIEDTYTDEDLLHPSNAKGEQPSGRKERNE